MFVVVVVRSLGFKGLRLRWGLWVACCQRLAAVVVVVVVVDTSSSIQ